MKVILKVPYEEKDQAKLLGARWDSAKKTWFVLDPENLSIYARWLGKPAEEFYKGKQRKSKHWAITAPKNGFKPLCDCPVLPWEPCKHTYELL